MNSTRLLIEMVAVVGVLAGAAGSLHAQSLESGELTVKQAYQKGSQSYDSGNYEKAAEYFRYAVDNESHPVLHFNLSQAYLQLGNLEGALEQARLADEGATLEGPASAANRGTLAAGRVLESARTWTPPRPPSGNTSSEQTVSSRTDARRRAIQSETKQTSPLLSALGWSGAGGTGAGVGLLIGAAAVDAGLTDDFEARRNAHDLGDQQRVRTLTDRIRRQQTTGQILLFSGVGLGVAGAGLLVYDLIRPSAPTTSTARRFSISVHPRALGLTVTISGAVGPD